MPQLPSEYQSYIHLSRYSRWKWEEKRRETWDETVKRYFDFFENFLQTKHNFTLSKTLRKELETSVLNLEIVPSMRCLMTAGEALERDQIAGYNCAFIAVEDPRAFDEILYLLACGVGVGFSVERQYINQLPRVAEKFYKTETTIVVPDSKIGWAKSLKELLGLLYQGMIPNIDYSRIRPQGAPLKTFGGRASGPDPLKQLFEFSVNLFQNCAGRTLQSIECHDLICKIADVIVVGGVRRSALISLSNLSDDRMRSAKTGQWWITNGQRALANNSACYTEKPNMEIFLAEWLSLIESKSGERGIFNLDSARKYAEKTGRRIPELIKGTNPCGEILLRSRQTCNLSEVVIRPDDTKDSLLRKTRLAAILGTFQSCLTDFRYLSKGWEKNVSEERLLGVSLTGIYDNSLTNTPSDELRQLLEELRQNVVDINKQFAKKLNINHSTATTCIKPSGTASQLVNCSSGIHPRHSEYYLRTIRADNKDPLCMFMKEMGFPWEPCVMKGEYTSVFYFPMKSPKNSVIRKNVSAIEHLELWKFYKKHWAEHTVSITVTVKESEWLDVAAYVYKNFDDITGISFLPYDDHSYKQAPYQECDKATFEKYLEKMPKSIQWSKLTQYETTDQTEGSQEFACSGNKCEL
jgi:ribonucleoside-diphosphate reductase alpha chain